MTEIVEINKIELQRLQDCANELACLEYAGVDNWEGYHYAFEQMKENFPETYKRKFNEEV
jgi:hypothetical protein